MCVGFVGFVGFLELLGLLAEFLGGFFGVLGYGCFECLLKQVALAIEWVLASPDYEPTQMTRSASLSSPVLPVLSKPERASKKRDIGTERKKSLIWPPISGRPAPDGVVVPPPALGVHLGGGS